MTKRTRKNLPPTVTWLSEIIVDPNCLSNSFQHYQKFQFQNLVAEIGDFVLISNADAAEPDTEDGCDAARIVSLYEDSSNHNDPFRAKVQWYSKPSDLPSWCFNNVQPIQFLEKELIEDHRPFNTDVSIETFFKKCFITFTVTKDTKNFTTELYHYVCRHRLISLTKRKVVIEPVMANEREALQKLETPSKITPSSKTTKSPTSLVKRMSRVSISEQKSWSVSKTDGTKLLLKRAIFADKTEKESPKKVTSRTPRTSVSESRKTSTKSNKNTEKDSPKKITSRTPRTSVSESRKTPTKLNKNNLEEILSMELHENSDEELPTLIIRQHVPTTPKRKQSVCKINEETPKKALFEDNEKSPYTTRSGRIKSKISYMEEETSPMKRTSRRTRKVTESDEDFKPALKIPSVYSLENLSLESVSKRMPRCTRKVIKSEDAVKTVPSVSPQDLFTDSTPKRTPRRTRKKSESDDDFTPIPKTPKTPNTPRTPRTVGQTPKQRVSRKIINQMTPTLQSRAHSIDNINEYVKDNKSLPGRESQLNEILSFVRSKLLDGTSGCMYISGVPGTGKTATVCSALNILKDEVDLPEFQLVEVNGMRIAEPRQAYVHIYKQLTGKSVVWEQACSLLEKRFTNTGPRRTPTVLLVDELDALCTRRQDVLYSIMEWAAHNTALLTVLAVANTMDLPERALAARVASRLGLTRLTFPPYTHTQLQNIVVTRLAGANVTPDAVQLIARKVAAVSGDARRAIALCTRALELAGAGGAGLSEVTRALGEAASGAAVTAIRHCAPAEILMLRAVAAEVERTGSDETTLSRALSTAAAIVSLDGRPYRSAPHIRPPTPSQALAICSRLAALRLLLLEHKPAEPRLLLNVSADDVHYATRQICA